MTWDSFHGIDQYKFLNNLTKFLEDWIKFSDEERDEYFKKFLKHGEEKECKVTFLSRVFKCSEDTLLSILYNYHINEKEFKEFQEKIKRIRELYFTINPRLTENIKLDQKRIEYLINQTSSLIISKAFIADILNCYYDKLKALFRRNDLTDLKKLLTQKQRKGANQDRWKEDLRNKLLGLLKQAPKEAFKSEEDLFYYLLLKDFYYFKSCNMDNLKSDFIEQFNSIYMNKLEISNKSQLLFSYEIFNDLKTKFKNFHDNNDYKSKLEILEQKRKNYPDFCDNKDCNNLVVNNDELNKSNDSWIEGSMNISQTNSPDYSNNGNKRKLEEKCSNEITQNNYKKRLRDEYSKQNLDNSDTCDSQGIQEKKSYTNFSINSILGIKAPNNTKLNYSNFSIRHLLGIEKPENQNLLNRQ